MNVLRPLILTEHTLAQIRQAREKARARTIPWEVLQPFAIAPDSTGTLQKSLPLKDRKPGSDVLSNRAENVLIARGYRAAISFEEQPAGIIRHLSVSVDKPGKLPSPAAVNALLIAFGFDVIEKGTSQIWTEEFEPGHEAINVVQLETEAPVAGHA